MEAWGDWRWGHFPCFPGCRSMTDSVDAPKFPLINQRPLILNPAETPGTPEIPKPASPGCPFSSVPAGAQDSGQGGAQAAAGGGARGDQGRSGGGVHTDRGAAPLTPGGSCSLGASRKGGREGETEWRGREGEERGTAGRPRPLETIRASPEAFLLTTSGSPFSPDLSLLSSPSDSFPHPPTFLFLLPQRE